MGPYSSARVTSKGTTAPRHHRTFQGPSLPWALTHSRARVTNKEATAPRHNKASRLRDNNRCAPPPRVGRRPRRWRQTMSSPHRGKVVADRVGSGQRKWKATTKGLITAARIFEDVLFFNTQFQKVEYFTSCKNVNCVQLSLAQSSIFYFHWAQRSKIPIKSRQNHQNGAQDPTDQSYRLKADPLYSSKVQRHSLELGPQGSSGSSWRSRDGLIVRGGEHQQSCHLPIKERAWPPAFPQYQHLLASADKGNTSNPGASFFNPFQARFLPPKGPKENKIQNKSETNH